MMHSFRCFTTLQFSKLTADASVLGLLMMIVAVGLAFC